MFKYLLFMLKYFILISASCFFRLENGFFTIGNYFLNAESLFITPEAVKRKTPQEISANQAKVLEAVFPLCKQAHLCLAAGQEVD